MVVEVSPWHIASSFGRCCLSPASICSGVNTAPQGASRTRRSAPTRRAISIWSWPKRPKLATSTRSPGSTTLTIAASMADRAVPSTTNVHSFFVSKTWR